MPAQSGSVAAPSGGHCTPLSFDLPTDNPNPSGPTAQAALDTFLAHGSVFGAAPPSEAPGKVGYPRTGWRQTKSGAETASFQSGLAELDLTRVGGNSWIVTSGHC